MGDYTAALARALAARGHDVTVFTQPAAGPRPAGLRVVEVPLHGWRDLLPTLRAIEASRVQHVQLEYSSYGWSRWGFAFWANALVLALRAKGLPVTVALHEFPLRFIQHPLQVGIAAIQRIHFWLLAACALRVLTNTPQRVRVLRRWLPWHTAKVGYRPNFSTIPVAALSEEARAQLRRSHGADSETLVVATFGLFQKDKNYEAVIEAVAGLRGHRTVQLWLLGNFEAANASYVARLRGTVAKLHLEDVVFWSGLIPAAEVSAHLEAADIFVLPQPDGHLTRSSAFMAAAAHGLPVIAVRNRENQKEFTHEENLWLVERSTPAEFACALDYLARDAPLRQKLGEQVQRLYGEAFAGAAFAPVAGVTARAAKASAAPDVSG